MFAVAWVPTRLSLGGGGTDVEAYYRDNGGAWSAAAISLPLHITVDQRIDDFYVLKYGNRTERVPSIDEIEHDLIRNCLKYMRMDCCREPLYGTSGLEISITSRVPTRSGLGVSGAMIVGLLQICHLFHGQAVTRRELAEMAYHVEHDLACSSSTGKQDQYIAVWGGITSFQVDPDGFVTITPLNHKLTRHTVAELENNLVLFGTQLERQETADQALARAMGDLKKPISGGVESAAADYLTQIKEIGHAQRVALLMGDTDLFGRLLDDHWKVKTKYAGEPDPKVAEAYTRALSTGALGGKVIGASSQGAFMVFYCSGDREPLRRIIGGLEMVEIPWKFEYRGSTIVHID